MPGSNNFVEWNPTQSNQKNDAQYLVDAQRVTGLQLDSITPSPTANKAFRQWSVMCAALGQALAAKGYAASDANVAALAAVLANLVTQNDRPIFSLPMLIGGTNSSFSQPKETIFNIVSGGLYILHYYFSLLTFPATAGSLQVEFDWNDGVNTKSIIETLQIAPQTLFLSRSLAITCASNSLLQYSSVVASTPAGLSYQGRWQLVKV